MSAAGAVPDGPRRVALDARCFVGVRTGVGNYIAALLAPLSEQHPEVSFHLYSNEALSFPARANVVTRVSAPKRRGPWWHNTHVVEMLREDGIEVFWGTNGLIPLRGLGRTATVLTLHDLVYHFAPRTQTPMMRWQSRVFQPMCARAADRVVAVSEATAHDVAAVYGRRPDHVVHPLIAPQFGRSEAAAADDALASLNLPADFILTVGTLEPRKNIATLIEAICNRVDAGVKLPPLVVVGGRGWADDRIVALIERAGASGAVRFLGFVPNGVLPHLYTRCRAFVMPSVYEGFGMPLLEAQLCGAPVVHGTHPSMREAAGPCGVVVEPSFDGLCRMLDDLANASLPLACRLPSTIDNNAERRAAGMWEAIAGAWRSKTQQSSNRARHR